MSFRSKILVFSFLITILLSSCSIFRKAVPDNRTLQEKVESKNFSISITHSNPSNLSKSYLGNDVELRLNKDSAFAHLPFFGVLNTIPMDQNDGGVNFEKPMKDFVLKKNPQVGWNLFFKIDTPQYKYQVRVDVAAEGKTVIYITSTERSPMTYYGEVE